MKAKQHSLEALAGVLMVAMVMAVVVLRSGTASGYPTGPTPTPFNPQGLTPRAYLPIVLKPVPFTSSHYMNKSASPFDPYSLGSNDAVIHDADLTQGLSLVMVLDFGQPCSFTSGGTTTYGAFAYSSTCHGTTTDVETDVKSYIAGYCAYLAGVHPGNSCGYNFPAPKVRIGVGANNCTNGGSGCTNIPGNSNVTTQNGNAWGQMVNDLNSYVGQNGYSSVVQVIGAMDIELSWNNPTNTINWLNGFGSASPGTRIYNFGDCECSIGYNPNTALPNSWTYEYVWQASWGATTYNPYPLPEIYNTTGANAYQWQGVSHYGKVSHSNPLFFIGPMTEMQACIQVGSCSGIDNTPDQGLSQLTDAISQDPLIAYTVSSFWNSTDIDWYPHS